jgi:hypothetical protein
MAKKAALILTGVYLLMAMAARGDLGGAWTATTGKRPDGRLQLQLHRGHDNTGQTMKIADFTGLSAAQVASAAATPVTFSLRREAGTVSFEGSFRAGSGSGTFVFAPDAAYLEELRSLGVPASRGKHRGESEEEQLLSLAVLDVSTDFIRSMQGAGYRVSLDKYIAMRIFDVNPELIADFRELGMTLDADQLIAGRIHGVTPAYVAQMRDLGRRADFDDLIATRIHGATPEFIAEMRDHGYGDLDLDDYVAFRIHGVSPKFVEELADLGYRDLSADDLVAFRIHGVTAEMIRELQAEGYDDISPDDLVSMKIHGRWRR